jgi:4-hydroxybenzoate polyprenyltransferase
MRHYFRLVRIPTVFSALSNAYAGWWIGGAHAPAWTLLLGLIASGLFLMAGMALNDIADLKADRAERPDRPLPSGAITLGSAWSAALGMMGLALLLQWIANPAAAQVGALLAAAIFLYNFALKGTFLGPLSMGLCRALNLAAGMALNFAMLSAFASLSLPVYGALLSLGAYVALVTYLARDEVQGNSLGRVRFFFFGLAAWFAAWASYAALHPRLGALLLAAVLALLLYLLSEALSGLRRNPGAAPATGKTVGALLRSLPAVDVVGMLAAGVAWPWALLGLAWMLPGRFLAKRFYST